MSSRDFDLFYASADGEPALHTYVLANIDGAQTLNANGTTFDMKLDSSFLVGDRVTLTDTVATPDVVTNCVITAKVASPATVTLRPLFSDADTGDVSGVEHSFPDNSQLAPVVGQDAATLVTDLSEAPEDAYEYIVAACGRMDHGATASRTVEAWVRRALIDDPLTGDKYGEARVTLPNAAGSFADAFNYVSASHHALDGGQRYEFKSQFKSVPNSGYSSRMSNARLMAIRIDPDTVYRAGDGKTSEQTFTSSEIYLQLDDVPAGDYLLIASWQANVDDASPTGSESAQIQVRSTGPIAVQQFNAVDTSDFYPGGFFGKITLASIDDLLIKVSTGAGDTVKVRHGMIVAIPLSSLMGEVVSQVEDPGNIVLSDDEWTSLEDSGPKTLPRRRHVEVIQCSATSSERFELRPKYGNPNISDPTGLGLHGQTLNGDDPRQATFFFHRSKYDDGDVTNELEGRIPDDPTGGTIKLNDVYFTWLRERAELDTKPQTPVTIVADMQPGLHIKAMAAGGATDRFKKAFPGFGLFSTVKVNSELYTEVASTGAMVAKTWFWDTAARELYIQFESGDAPGDSDIYTVVQPLVCVGQYHEDLIGPDGELRSYAARIDGVPDAAQELTSSDGRYSSGVTLGSLELINGDGEYDDKDSQWHWDGYPARIYLTHRSLSNDLADAQVIADAIMGRPRWSPDGLRLTLFDRSQLLRKTVKLTSATVKEGYTGDGNLGPRDRDDQEFPFLYGVHRRVVAYRTQANEGTTLSNEYKFASDTSPVVSVDAAFLNPDDQEALDIATHWSGSAGDKIVDLAVGRIDLSNDAFVDPDQPPDVIYINVTGNRPTVGEAFEVVLKERGGLVDTGLVKASFRGIDRGGRKQLDIGTGKLRRVAVNVGLRIDTGERIADVLDRLAEHTGTYWGWNRQGRAFLDVPDFDAHNLVTNGFFELDDVSAWPWSGEEGATLTVSTSRSFAVGENSLEIANGSDAGAYAVQRVLFPRAGHYVVTLPALSISGNATAFKVGVLPGDGEELQSPAQTLSTTQWTRVTFPVLIDRGHVGQTEIRIYPAEGSATATTVAIDAVEVYALAAVAEQNSEVLSVEYEDDDAFETAVGFDRDQQSGRHSTATVDHAGALGLSTTEPEGKHVVGTAGTIDLSDALVTDAASAAGIAASLTATHGRQRQRMEIIMKNLSRIPIIGDRIIHRNHPRIPEASDGHPVWRVVESSYDGDDPQDVLLTVRRQLDPALDRMEVV